MSKRAEERARQAFPGQQLIHDRCVFKFGYESAEKDLGWHSVDESLPETGEEVIVLIDELNFHLFYRLAFGHIGALGFETVKKAVQRHGDSPKTHKVLTRLAKIIKARKRAEKSKELELF